jgi:hypothetical protein
MQPLPSPIASVVGCGKKTPSLLLHEEQCLQAVISSTGFGGGQKVSSFRPHSFGTTHSLLCLSLSLPLYPITASRVSKKNLGPASLA